MRRAWFVAKKVLGAWLPVVLSACAITVLGACTPSHGNARPAVIPANLVDLGEVEWDFSWRQSIRATYVRPDHGGRVESAAFEAVLQKEGRTLTLVGLTPFGSRAFVIRQVGSKVSVQQGEASALPFEAGYIMLDVNRCFFLGIYDKALADGWHQQELKGEIIQDLWQAGRLKERVFRPKAGPDSGEVVVRYSPGFTRRTAPAQVELVNHRYRYRLEIKLLEAEVP